jgi:hypothetical protein
LGALLAFLLAACGSPSGDEPFEARHVESALKAAEPLARAEQLARIYQRLPAGELRGVLATYEDAFYDQGDMELVLLAEWWSKFDAPGALKWAQTEWRADQPAVARSVWRAWARADPKAALRQLESRKGADPSIRDAMISGWEESGVGGHFEYVRALSPGDVRQRALATLARRKVLREGVDAAFDWAESMPDDDDKFKLNLIRRVGSAAVLEDPLAAARRATPLIGEPVADGLARRMAVRWALRHGDDAMRWLLTLPAGFSRDEAVREGYRSWITHDREAALRFMEGATEPALDPARALYAAVVGRDDPQRGFEIAAEIEDEELRWATTGRIWRRWWQTDETAAKAWHERATHIPAFYHKRMAEIPPALRRAKNKDRAGAGAKAELAPTGISEDGALLRE